MVPVGDRFASSASILLWKPCSQLGCGIHMTIHTMKMALYRSLGTGQLKAPLYTCAQSWPFVIVMSGGMPSANYSQGSNSLTKVTKLGVRPLWIMTYPIYERKLSELFGYVSG